MAHAPKTRSEKAVLSARRAWCYLVLVLISFLCLFFFYILIVNSTRTHFEIQKGFSLLPGKSMLTNFKNVLADANIPMHCRYTAYAVRSLHFLPALWSVFIQGVLLHTHKRRRFQGPASRPFLPQNQCCA